MTRTRARLVYSVVICLTGLFCTLLIACGNPAQDERARLAADKSATAELTRINSSLVSGRSVSKADLDLLARLRQQYPNVSEIRQLMQNALIMRGDWAEVEKLINEIPDAQRTAAERLNLAKVYIKQGKFTEAVELLQKLKPDAAQFGGEVESLLGQAQFFSGDLAGGAASLESVRDSLIGGKRADELAILGTIYSRRGEHAKAIEILQKALETSPENLSALNALSRAYSAGGDTANAELYRARVESVNAKVAAEEKKKSRVVPLFYKLEDAYAAKDFDKVIALVRQLEPEADDKTKPTLYQYLAAAYQAQGKEAEAKNALAEAQKFAQK